MRGPYSCFWLVWEKWISASNPLYSVFWKCPLHSRHSICDADDAVEVRVSCCLKLCEMSEVNSVLEKEKQRENGEMKWGGYVSVFIGMAIT